MLVEAPAGMGKSALLVAARDAAESAGLRFVRARGTESEQEWGYGVVRQLYEPLVAAAAPTVRDTLLAGAAALAAHVVAGAAESPMDATSPIPDSSSVFATLHGLFWLTANLADQRPLLVLVDDLHWSDQASLRYLGYLSRRIEGMSIGLLAATRPPDSAEVATWVSELRGADETEVLSLDPLSVEAVAGLVAMAMAKACGTGFAAACHAVTGGNPFLVSELLRSLADLGIEPVDASAGAVVAIGPHRVAEHFLVRLARLAPAATSLAEVLAVLGPATNLVPAAEIAELTLGQASDAADALVNAGILEDGRPLTFVHPIVSTSIAAELAASRRAAIHVAAASRFAADPDGGERAAAHLLATDPTGQAWTAELLMHAARRSLARGAPDAAVRYLRRLLREPLGDVERGETLAVLGFAESHLRSPAAVEHLLLAMDYVGTVERETAIAVALGRILQLAGQPRRAVEVSEAAARRVAGRDRTAELVLRGALLGAAQLHTDTVDVAERERAWLQVAVEEDRHAPHTVFGPLAAGSSFAGEPADETATLARRALAGVKLLPEALDRPPFFYHATTALLFAEQFGEVEALLDQSLADALSLGSIQHVVGLSALRALLHSRTGRLADAEADARQVLEMGAPPMFMAEATAALIDVLVDRGELDAANEALAAARFDGQVGTTIFSGMALAARGRLRLAEQRPEAAVEDLLGAGELQQALRADSPSFVGWRGDVVPALLLVGRSDEAAALAEEELELAAGIGAPRALGRALRAAALAAQPERSMSLLQEAADTLADSGAPLEHARALIDIGAAIRRAGQRKAARRPLTEAMHAAHRHGAWALVEQARTELHATGARPRRIAVRGVDALTASERRVALLAARGLTNREIAQALFVTPRTVEGHLTHVYQKLDVGSRRELPAMMKQ